MDTLNINTLLQLQEGIAKELAARGSGKKEKKEKKEKVSRIAGVWAVWTKEAPLAHPEEYAAFKASSEKKQGVTPLFCSKWREDHPEEYAAFKLKFESEALLLKSSPAESPASVTSVASVASVTSVAPKVKKQSEETKAKAALKRAATKAAKKAAEDALLEMKKQSVSAPVASVPKKIATPVAALPMLPVPQEEDEDEEDEEAEEAPELLHFKLAGRNYLRPGYNRAGSSLWASGDLWATKKVKDIWVKGEWEGVLEEDGSIDTSAEEPEIE